MYFTRMLPAAAMLVTAIGATPVRIEHSRRQLGDLTGILKGIMDVGSSSSSGSSSDSSTSNSGTTVPATTTSADTIALQQCSDAISKIEAALSMSASYMKAAGAAPTPQEIQAVLIVLEQSLGADCDEDITQRNVGDNTNLQERSEGPLAGILGDGDGNGGPLGTGIPGGGNDDEYQNRPCYDKGSEEEEYCDSDEGAGGSTDQRMNAQADTTALRAQDAEETNGDDMERRATDSTSYSDSCSDCERQLYHIVKELQVIFALGARSSSDLPGMSSSIAAVPTTTLFVPLSEITNLPKLTGTSLSQITEMPQAN